jgi:hypothetical protein
MTDQHDQEEREAVRRLFAGSRLYLDLDQAQAQARDGGNHVPQEGNGNGMPRPADYDVRDFVGQLFGTHPNDRNLHTTDHEH